MKERETTEKEKTGIRRNNVRIKIIKSPMGI